MCYPKEKASMDQQRTIWTVITAAVVVVLVVISAMAYQSTQVSSGSTTPDRTTEHMPYRALTFDLNLPPLSAARYMLWAVDTSGQYTLIKEFLVNDSLFITDRAGKPLSTTIDVPDFDLHQAASFMVTIEDKEGTVTTPSATVVLQTRQRSGSGYTLTFPYNVAAAHGSYMLATPTNGTDTQETSGVWFASPASLTLPAVPRGWIYAAWLTHESVWLPMGAFSDPSQADDLARFSGPRTGFTAPGEDFLTNARNGDPTLPLDLTDGKSGVVITLQPENLGTKDDRPVYQLPLLQGAVQTTAITNTAYNLDAVANGPSGVIRIITK